MIEAGLPIGRVARGAGVNIQTVRYYERRGLLTPPARRPSGQRTYEPSVVDLLRTVKRAQALGFTLAEIEEILRLSGRTGRGPDALRARMREKIAEIDRKIADLHLIRERLADALHAGCDSLADCTCPDCPPLTPAGSRPNQSGSGGPGPDRQVPDDQPCACQH